MDKFLTSETDLCKDAFERRIKCGKLKFLEDLSAMMLGDEKLNKSQKRQVKNSFELMNKFIGRKHACIDSICLADWEMFGLSKDIIDRIGFFSFEYDSIYPADYHNETESNPEDLDLEEDEFSLSFEQMSLAFQHGFRAGGEQYLDELQTLAFSDHELMYESETIASAFQAMKVFLGHSEIFHGHKMSEHDNHQHGTDSDDTAVNVVSVVRDSIDLRDWRQFGLSEDIVHRLGYLALCRQQQQLQCQDFEED